MYTIKLKLKHSKANITTYSFIIKLLNKIRAKDLRYCWVLEAGYILICGLFFFTCRSVSFFPSEGCSQDWMINHDEFACLFLSFFHFFVLYFVCFFNAYSYPILQSRAKNSSTIFSRNFGRETD